MTTATDLYALNLAEATSLVRHSGDTTVLVQGHMGTGKSSMLKILAQELPDHIPCYFDCTTKDLGDITIPNVMNLNGIVSESGEINEEAFVRYVTNEELGVHLNKPIILMIDEYGKARRRRHGIAAEGVEVRLAEHRLRDVRARGDRGDRRAGTDGRIEQHHGVAPS
mgnify:CR=1 FL=1